MRRVPCFKGLLTKTVLWCKTSHAVRPINLPLSIAAAPGGAGACSSGLWQGHNAFPRPRFEGEDLGDKFIQGNDLLQGGAEVFAFVLELVVPGRIELERFNFPANSILFPLLHSELRAD